jgi:peptide/nickel transport system permease protein
MSSGTISWTRYVLTRLVIAIPSILLAISFNFILIHLAPGDPVLLLTGDFAPTPELKMAIEREFGLDKPIWEQLVIYISRVMRGNLGYSIRFREPALSLIVDRLGATLLLMGTAITISLIIGVILGVLASRNPYSYVDNIATGLSLFGWSLPIFWLAQILMITFSINLGLFPVSGMRSLRVNLTGFAYIFDVMWHLFLPAMTIILLRLAQTFRLTRASMLEVLGQDYIITARSKGLSERTVLLKHALKNALRPIITMTGMQLGTMLAGATMTEIVFSWPGMGRLVYEAVLARDYPVLMGIYLIIVILVILANFVTDIVYALYDPRVRYQ